jgi:hypothetical protein
MKICISEESSLILKEVFNAVTFETEDGELLSVAMRDSGFEIGVSNKNTTHISWHSVNQKDGIELLCAKNPKKEGEV